MALAILRDQLGKKNNVRRLIAGGGSQPAGF
jgi:hypothetical protein